MQQKLDDTDLEVLRTILAGRDPSVTADRRCRLEMMGLVHDETDGLWLTKAGQKAAVQEPQEHFEDETTLDSRAVL